MATITFDLTVDQATRTQAAVGRALGLLDAQNNPRPATGPEARTFIIGLLKSFVLNSEKAERLRVASIDATFDVT